MIRIGRAHTRRVRRKQGTTDIFQEVLLLLEGCIYQVASQVMDLQLLVTGQAMVRLWSDRSMYFFAISSDLTIRVEIIKDHTHDHNSYYGHKITVTRHPSPVTLPLLSDPSPVTKLHKTKGRQSGQRGVHRHRASSIGIERGESGNWQHSECSVGRLVR